MIKILVVDDNESMLDVIEQTLSEEEGFSVTLAKNGGEGLREIKRQYFDLVISDMEMPCASGMDILKELRRASSKTALIFITAYGTIEKAVASVRQGAFDFIAKPFEPDTLMTAVKRALQTKNIYADTSVNTLPLLETSSDIMREVYKRTQKVARSSAAVLLLGESGTGKEVLAQSIHKMSPRSGAPIVSINCAAIASELLESELFGHEKGAFTGADKRKIGKFELADGGTLFLDEVGDMSINLQAKILRVIQETAFERVGGTNTIKVDIRLICATNKNLKALIESGEFREDLFYRISVFPIYLPPLRERREDIPMLAKYFAKKYSLKMGISDKEISDDGVKALSSMDWPGNIRELENALERALILCETDKLHPHHFREFIENAAYNETPDTQTIPGRPPSGESLEESVRNIKQNAEREYIKAALQQAAGNKLRTAKKLKVSYKTLLTKIKKYQIT